jgi:hypothetical protein
LALRHASLRHSGVQLVICRELPDAGCLAAFCDQPILEKVTNWLRAARYAPFGQLYSAKALSGFARFNLGQWLALESYWGLTIHTSTCLFFAAKAVCGNWYCQFCSMDAIAAALTVSLVSQLVALMVACADTVASAKIRSELRLFSEALQRHQEVGLDKLLDTAAALLHRPAKSARAANPLDEADIRNYVQRLEEALGDEDGFDQEYKRLTADARMKVADAKKIAKAFAGKSGGSKAEAFNLIAGRQSSLIGARAKANATAGRSAA